MAFFHERFSLRSTLKSVDPVILFCMLSLSCMSLLTVIGGAEEKRLILEDGSVIEFSGKSLRDDDTGRRPFFDIEINAMKKSPTEAQQKNQFAKELYDSGAFKKENIKETLMMLELMDFEGVGNLKVSLRSEYGE